MEGMNGVSILIVIYVDCSVFNYYIAWKNNTNLELKKQWDTSTHHCKNENFKGR